MLLWYTFIGGLMQRYFTNNYNENKFTLTDTDTHHIKKVMRMNVGDEIELVYNNELYITKIISLNNLVECQKLKKLDSYTSNVKVDIAQSLIIEKKFDFVIQKATELGVNSIIPINVERSIVKIEKKDYYKKQGRWQKIADEASRQSKRIKIPTIMGITNINELIDLDYDIKILCSVEEHIKTIKSVLQNVDEYARILLVIGPEGGFSTSEEQLLIKNGFVRVTLGDLVLRTETASLAILSMINYHFMR